eukprot:6259190-Heterocapsa_arctica.AAC.1
MSWKGKGQGKYPGWTCQKCGMIDNWQTKTFCRACFEPHPILAIGQSSGGGGKGKGHNGQWTTKGAKGRCSQSQQKGPQTEDGEHQEAKREIAKLQQVERTLTELGDAEEGVQTVQTKIKELKLQINGGIEPSRTQKAQ